MAKACKPIPGQVYTFKNLIELKVEDTPCLNIMLKDRFHPIQDSHMDCYDIIKNHPEFADSKWRYIRTTIEWVPIFNFVGTEEEALKLVDFEPYVDHYSIMDKGALWVTPKGSPRPQHY